MKSTKKYPDWDHWVLEQASLKMGVSLDGSTMPRRSEAGFSLRQGSWAANITTFPHRDDEEDIVLITHPHSFPLLSVDNFRFFARIAKLLEASLLHSRLSCCSCVPLLILYYSSISSSVSEQNVYQRPKFPSHHYRKDQIVTMLYVWFVLISGIFCLHCSVRLSSRR